MNNSFAARISTDNTSSHFHSPSPHKPVLRPPVSLTHTNLAHTHLAHASLAQVNTDPASLHYETMPALVQTLTPSEPVQILRPHVIKRMAKWFLAHFPGDVMYSVKSNPDIRVLSWLYDAGIRTFDTASLPEVALVAEHFPDAEQYFMHPVKSREAIAIAYHHYGVRHFSLDSHQELHKILDVTGGASDLHLYVRLAIPNETAMYQLTGKFGVALEKAVSLLQATHNVSQSLGVCFHVGSQAMDPAAFSRAVGYVEELVRQSGVRLDVVDVGGGFPSVYPGMTPPPLIDYMHTIRVALQESALLRHCRVLAEPGRALVAEGGAVLTRVELRKGNALYLNDGVYGTLFDAGTPRFPFPVRAYRANGRALADAMQPFVFFGPTCDSADVMEGPFHLPEDIAEGDWIEVGQLGAYGATMRTRFNGFYSDLTAEVNDAPQMSVFGDH